MTPMNTTCKKCEMSFMRGAIEDEELHRGFCKKMSGGIDWPFLRHFREETMETGNCELVEEGIRIGRSRDHLEGSIWMIRGNATGPMAKKVK